MLAKFQRDNQPLFGLRKGPALSPESRSFAVDAMDPKYHSFFADSVQDDHPAGGAASPPPVRRRDLRQAARAVKVKERMRRIRRVSRLGTTALVAAIVTPIAVVGGIAYASLSGDGQLTVKPGGSATSEAISTFADGQGAVTFELPGRPKAGALYVGTELRRTTTGSFYRTKVAVWPDGTVSIGIGKVIERGSEQSLGSRRLPFTVGTQATSLSLQGSVIGSTTATVAVRAWLEGTAQPGWQLSVLDRSAVTGTGSGRVWAYLSAQATAPMTFGYHDETGVSGPAPTPPPTTAPTASPTPSATRTSAAPTTTAPKPSTSAPKPTTTAPSNPTNPTSPTVDSVLAASGARLPIEVAVPSGAVVISPGDSIAAAVARASSGGTVVLHGGTYRQAVGSINKPITIQAYPGERPVLSGTDVVGQWTASGNAWRATSWTSPFGQSQYRADEVQSGTATGKVEQVYRNGKALTQVANRSQLRTGTFWIDPYGRQLWIGDNPSGATMEVSNRDRAMTLERGAAGSKILGLRFTAYASPHLDNGSQLSVMSNNTLIRDSQFDHSSGAGIKIAGTGITVDHSTMSDNGAEGMTGNRNDNSVIKNSAFLRNNADGFVVVGCAMSCTVAGFKTAHTANLKVLDNAFVGNDSNGFWCDLGCTGATISGNAVSGGNNGLYYEVSSGAKIENNYVENVTNGIRVSGSDHVTVTGNTLRNNKWQFTVYDDPRSPSTDAYSAGLGLTWNTTNLVLSSNTIKAGSATTMLLAANATAQVASPRMYSQAARNSVTGNEVMVWCSSNGNCKSYSTVAQWKAASGLPFS
jgi:poly(beta-D-mannuronate) C5 epimerase